jgi:hypothetical protein
MATYQCYFRNDAGAQVEHKAIHTDTDAGARKIVLDMLRDRPEIRNVEVWQDADFAFRLSRCELHINERCKEAMK